MRRLFADTFYWMALLYARDQWYQRVVEFSESLDSYHIFTTDAVFIEYLTAFSARGQHLRQQAVASARHFLHASFVTIIPQTRDLLLEGIALYENHPNKEYSLTDCISMHVMRHEGISEVLTNDHHFRQEGFRVLFE